MMYVKVSWRPDGVPSIESIIDAASAGFSSRKDQSCLDIYEEIGYDDAKSFLERLISWDHTSVLEHIVFKFHISLSTACASQLTRHRMASYTQKSYRIARKLDETRQFIVPPNINMTDIDEWIDDMQIHIDLYNKWLDKGYDADIARYHLQQGIYTNVAITINARSLRNMFKQRMDKHAILEFREVSWQMYNLIVDKGLDFLFNDIVSEAYGK